MSEPVSSLQHAQLASTFGASPWRQLCAAHRAGARDTPASPRLLVHSGSLLEVFQDDRTYPFEAHAPFKVWAPLQDAPGQFRLVRARARPRLILHQPQDYWYKSAQTPQRLLGRALRPAQLSPTAPQHAALLPQDLSGTAYIGDALPELAAWGVRRGQSRRP